jgi:hypothetical protein
MEVSSQLHAPAALPPGKRSESNWIGGWVGTRAGFTLWSRENCLSPAGYWTPATQPTARRYTDWAIPGVCSLLWDEYFTYLTLTSTHWIAEWVDLRAHLREVTKRKNSVSKWNRFPVNQLRSQSLKNIYTLIILFHLQRMANQLYLRHKCCSLHHQIFFVIIFVRNMLFLISCTFLLRKLFSVLLNRPWMKPYSVM